MINCHCFFSLSACTGVGGVQLAEAATSEMKKKNEKTDDFYGFFFLGNAFAAECGPCVSLCQKKKEKGM